MAKYNIDLQGKVLEYGKELSGGNAKAIPFDPLVSDLTANNVQDAIDELKHNEKFGKRYPVSLSNVIEINSQEDFDNLQSIIDLALQDTETQSIKVLFGGGLYKYTKELQFFSETWETGIPIEFANKNGEIPYFMSTGIEYTPADAIDETTTHYICPVDTSYTNASSFVDQDFNWQEELSSGDFDSKGANTTTEQVVETSLGSGVYKLKIPASLASLKNKTAAILKHSALYLDSWYEDVLGSELYSDNDYLYFKVNNLGVVGVDGDYLFKGWGGNKGTRYAEFRISNYFDDGEHLKNKVCVNDDKIYIPKNIRKLYQCNRVCFIHVYYFPRIGDIKIGGLTFVGTAKDKFSGEGDAVMALNALIGNITISNCIFKNSYSAINALGNGGIENTFYIHGNKFDTTFNSSLTSLDNCMCIVEDNIFNKNGLVQKSAPTINLLLYGANTVNKTNHITIKNNIIKNFSTSAIDVGGDNPIPDRGIIKNNIIFNEDFWNDKKYRYTLSDSGAIYVYNQGVTSFGFTIEANIIHDVRDKCDFTYRGIMVDDYSSNIVIKNNIIFNSSTWDIYVAHLGQQNTIEANIVGNNWDCRNVTQINNVGKANFVPNIPYYNNAVHSAVIESQDIVVNSFSTKEHSVYIDTNSTILQDLIKDYWIRSFIYDPVNRSQADIDNLNAAKVYANTVSTTAKTDAVASAKTYTDAAIQQAILDYWNGLY